MDKMYHQESIETDYDIVSQTEFIYFIYLYN
jgi:hypothetical protein